MQSEENEFSLSNLPKSQWSDEDVVDYDILVEIIGDAIGVLSKLKHEARSKDDPDQRLIERIDERRRRLSKSLRELDIGDVKTSEQLRTECLALIKNESL